MTEERNYWTDLLMRSRLSRRRLLRNGAMAGLSLAALSSGLSCGGGETQTAKTGSDQPKYGGYINTWHSTDPPHFDPHTTVSWAMWQPMGMVYSNLIRFKFGPNISPTTLELEGDLAEKWEQPDPLTVIFHLNKGVKWHDGSDFSAEDVKYSIERIKLDKEAVRNYMYAAVDKVEVVDPNTVRFKMSQPSAALTTFLAIPFSMIVSAKHAQKAADNLKKSPMGTGPFIMESYERNVKITFKKNPNFFKKGLPYVEGVNYYIIADQSTRYASFISKQIDHVTLNAEEEKQLKQDAPSAIIDQYGSYSWVRLRNLVDRPPFNDKGVRGAITRGIDRHAMIASEFIPSENKLYGCLPWPDPYALTQEELMKFPGYRKDRAKDVREAKELLSTAGYGSGLKVHIDCNTSYTTTHKQAEQIKEHLKEVGIESDITINEYAAFKKMEYAKTYPGLLFGAYVAYFDPDEYLVAFFHSKSQTDNENINDPKLDAMLDKQSQELNKEERKKQLWDIQKYILEQSYDHGLYAGVSRSTHHPYLKNYRYHAVTYTGRNFENVWLDK